MSNLINMTFGYLTVIGIDENSNNSRRKYICKCKCGNIKSILPYSLISGHTTSCGCKKYESKNYTHKQRNTRLYSIWCEMKKRCTNPYSKSYSQYGGRGISVCDEWIDSFQSFYYWSLKNGYTDNLSIDRIDNNSDYSPNNCRWITREEQQQNKSNTIKITHDGNTYSLSKWCKLLNVNFKTIYYRYTKLKNKQIEPTYELLFGSQSLR